MSTTYPDLPNTSFPEQVQSFVTMLNMSIADAQAVMGYQEAMRNGDYALAQQYFSQIANGEQKFIEASTMNKLMETCVALQRFYQSDIQPYINTKQTQWGAEIAKFSYQGSFNANTQYSVNNFVLYNLNGINLIFICTAIPPVGTLPTNTTYWRQLTIRGAQGQSGVGTSFRYAWDSTVLYYEQDIVNYENTLWLCVIQNSNQMPQSGSIYWKSIYTASQIVYPFQNNYPTNASEGDIWFQILGD